MQRVYKALTRRGHVFSPEAHYRRVVLRWAPAWSMQGSYVDRESFCQSTPDASITQMLWCCSKATILTYGNCCWIIFWPALQPGADKMWEVGYWCSAEWTPDKRNCRRRQSCEWGATRWSHQNLWQTQQSERPCLNEITDAGRNTLDKVDCDLSPAGEEYHPGRAVEIWCEERLGYNRVIIRTMLSQRARGRSGVPQVLRWKGNP